MKKLTFFLLFLGSMAHSFAANKYWVGGASGTWAATTSWSDISSAGASGATAPTTGDDVFFENGAATVTLGAATAVLNSITFTSSNVTFSGAFGIFTTNMTVDNSRLVFVNNVTINSSLTMSGEILAPRITVTAPTNGLGLKLGNGEAFTLTGHSATNYFVGNGNAYYTFNTTSPLTVFFSSTRLGSIVITKGLITLGNSTETQRISLSALNSEELIIGTNTILTVSGNGTQGFTSTANGGVIDASATGSKFVVKAQNAGFLATTGRIFKDATTIEHLEMNSSGYTFVPSYPLTVKNLTLTAGAINNTTNNITIPSGGNLVVGAGTTTAALNASVPSAPTIGIATAGNAQAAVEFTAPTANGGSLITGYTVTPYDGVTAGTPVTQNANPITVTGLTNGTAYTFTVIANNGVGASAESTASAAVTPDVSTGIDNATKLNAQVFVNTANQITIIAPEKSAYAIYNAVGMLLDNGVVNSKLITHNSNLSAGVYVVKVNDKSTKVIIK